MHCPCLEDFHLPMLLGSLVVLGIAGPIPSDKLDLRNATKLKSTMFPRSRRCHFQILYPPGL